MTEEDVAPPAEAPEEAGDGTEEAEAPAPQMTEFKVLVKSATKWWKSEEPEEGAEATGKADDQASDITVPPKSGAEATGTADTHTTAHRAHRIKK